MSSWARSDDLLYFGDSDAGIVRIFDYSHKYKPVGQLSITPFAVCSDAVGNVWVSGMIEEHQGLYEYRHDGSGPVVALAAYGGEGCAVDPKTGDVALVFWGDKQGARLQIYRGGQGSPETFYDTAVTDFYFAAYDNHSNLVIQGMNYVGQGEVVYAEFPAKAKKIRNLVVSQAPFPDAGGLAFDGKFFAAAFPNRNVIFRYALKKSALAEVSETAFNMPNFGFFGIAIHKRRMSAYAAEIGSYGQRQVVKLLYPSGSTLKLSQPTGRPAGITISVAPTSSKMTPKKRFASGGESVSSRALR